MSRGVKSSLGHAKALWQGWEKQAELGQGEDVRDLAGHLSSSLR
jgi:hypothetical protein